MGKLRHGAGNWLEQQIAELSCTFSFGQVASSLLSHEADTDFLPFLPTTFNLLAPGWDSHQAARLMPDRWMQELGSDGQTTSGCPEQPWDGVAAAAFSPAPQVGVCGGEWLCAGSKMGWSQISRTRCARSRHGLAALPAVLLWWCCRAWQCTGHELVPIFPEITGRKSPILDKSASESVHLSHLCPSTG